MSRSRASASVTELPRAFADEWPVLPSKSGVGGPRKMTHNTLSLEHAGEPLSIDLVPTPGRTPTMRRQSAKQLIYRFESMTDEAQTAQVKGPSSVRAPSEVDSRDMHRPFLTVASYKSKRRSLSNSLRNLMSVFKKKKDKESDDDDFIPPLYAPELNIVIPVEPALPPPKPQIVQQLSQKAIPLPSSPTNPTLFGKLLYLSRAYSHSPGWMSCVVTLYHSHLLITWYTLHDIPSTHAIELVGFMDVRSLNERVARPDTEGDLKAFELSFEGRPRETFAATSSQERARWIGAIWDAVLNSQHRSEPVQTPKRHGTLAIRTDLSSKTAQYLQPPSSPGEASSEYTSSSAPKTPSTHETPPPTPVSKSPRHTLSPLSLSPPRPPSQLSSPHSRSKSPSIANLGTLSVVTQRLAQIERSEVPSPASSTVTSSSVGTALRRAQTTHTTDQGRSFAEIERLQKEGAARSVETPSTDASIVIPLPNPPNVPPSETASVRSAFKRNRALPSMPTPPNSPTKALASIEVSTPILRAKLSEPAIRKHVENPPTTLSVVGVEPQLAPLAELIKDTAAKHYDQTAGLGEQIISLQRDIHILPNEIEDSLKQAVTKAVKRVSESSGHRDNAGLQNVWTSLEGLKKQVLANGDIRQMESLAKMFAELQTQLTTLAPLLLEKLASIEQGQTQLQLQAAREAERPPAPTEQSLQDGSHHTSVDLSDLLSKLDELASLYKSNIAAERDIPSSRTLNADSEKLQAILGHLTLDEEQRKLQLEQQTDSVRYLNELNSWLEAFVNGGAIHIQSVAANIEQLCSYLGVPLEGGTIASDGQPSSQGMLGEIRHLISSVQTKALGDDQLQASVGELMNAVKEQLKSGTERQTTLVTDSVLEIINRQRYEQEQMLRALSTELTNEIRGERLRFVEAMKEATAINVQAHVEHFKSELGREVAAMTQDVGRLHQEKQTIEQQIADLFSFFSKQKQEAENNARRNAPPRSAGFSNLQNLPSSTPKRPRRPLPHPVFQRKG